MTAKKLLRMDNVLIVVDDLEAAKAFFAELGMQLDHGITFSVTARSSMLLDSTAYSDETGLPDTCRIRRVEQIRENPNMGGTRCSSLFSTRRTRSGFVRRVRCFLNAPRIVDACSFTEDRLPPRFGPSGSPELLTSPKSKGVRRIGTQTYGTYVRSGCPER